MKVIHCNINSKIDLKNLVLAIGNFDGVHLGHQKIILQCIKLAKDNNLIPAILTFYPHPNSIINSKIKKKLIFDNVEKIELLKNFDIKYMFIFQFDHEFMNMSHGDFVEKILIKKFDVKGVVTGYNFHFGKNRLGNANFLSESSNNYGFFYEVIDKYKKDFIEVSSSKLRELIAKGMVETVRKILGIYYFISGVVCYGKKLAGKLGYKTANIKLIKDLVYPLNGVYLVRVTVKDEKDNSYYGVANIGVKPTFSQNHERMLEVHIFEFGQDIYEKDIKVEFISFLRPERQFSIVEELQSQIKRDINFAKYLLKIYA